MALPVIGKFSKARSVCTPKYAPEGICRLPSRSCSTRYFSVAMAFFLCGPAACGNPRIRLFGRLAHRLKDRLELPAHGDAQGSAGGELAQEPLLVDARQLARLGQPVEGAA